MSPAELFYAVRSKGEFHRRKTQEAYEIARFQAVMLINYDPQLPGKHKFKRMQDLVEFVWEEKTVQSAEDMKKEMLTMGMLYGDGTIHTKKSLDDPPARLRKLKMK